MCDIPLSHRCRQFQSLHFLLRLFALWTLLELRIDELQTFVEPFLNLHQFFLLLLQVVKIVISVLVLLRVDSLPLHDL